MTELKHPAVVRVYDPRGEDDAFCYFVMELVPGGNLREAVLAQRVDAGRRLPLILEVGEALAEAHSHRIIHRGIKPQNVMLNTSGQVKVLDFGLARIVHEGSLIDGTAETESLISIPGMVVGTVPYMSPEQVRGEHLDARSDIFSFGVVFYEILTGTNPFRAASVAETMSNTGSRNRRTNIRAGSPAASSSAWRSPARSAWSRRSCCSTSPHRRSIRR